MALYCWYSKVCLRLSGSLIHVILIGLCHQYISHVNSVHELLLVIKRYSLQKPTKPDLANPLTFVHDHPYSNMKQYGKFLNNNY